MPNVIDTKNLDSTAGAVYFVVGRGTEGGASDSYRLSVAGVTDSHWGDVSRVAANSGYSIGTIQVDLGQQGLQALGSANGQAAGQGQQTYVDAIIGQASAYAHQNNLPFPSDTKTLRSELLSHGNGQDGRSSITFLDKNTLHTFNTWAASNQGQEWIHHNIDYGQVKSITQAAMSMVDKYGKNITDDHRFETICILAKTQNQYPGAMDGFQRVLEKGGTYDDVLKHAQALRTHLDYYDGVKAGSIAEQYQKAYADPTKQAAIDRADAKVASPTYNPAAGDKDPDIKIALSAIGDSPHKAAGHVLENGMHGQAVTALQNELGELGYLNGKADGRFGDQTEKAVKAFQHDHHLNSDGKVGAATEHALHVDLQPLKQDGKTAHAATGAPGQDDPRNAANPNHTLFNALKQRRPDASENRLLQFTAACHVNGINEQNLQKVHFDQHQGVVIFTSGGLRPEMAKVDVKQPSPQPEQSIQQIQQFDQQQKTQSHAQTQAQSAQAQQGPVLNNGP
jgi:peptidoglycan hydrolase-like protein with peptidoglycan-binding domain